MTTINERRTERSHRSWAGRHWVLLSILLTALVAAVVLTLVFTAGGGGGGGGY
jgi:hypothetical protein